MSPNRHPNWQKIYGDTETKSLPWHIDDLDPDLNKALSVAKVGKEVLDVGAGDGSQAQALHQRGFQVTAIDVSATALQQIPDLTGLRKWQGCVTLLPARLRVDWAWDRGCFHVLPPQQRDAFVAAMARTIRPGGTLFLKCFAKQDLPKLRDRGPEQFAPKELARFFSPMFELVQYEECTFQGPLTTQPKALFCQFRRLL